MQETLCFQNESTSDYSPPPIISTINLENKKIYSVRDDLLIGGTKQRAIIPYLKKYMEKGIRHFIYASPFSGFAQVALAYGCQELGVDCTLFCEKDNDQYIHEFSLLSKTYGADIILCKSLAEADLSSQIFVNNNIKAQLIPLGFNDSEFRLLLEIEIEKHWYYLSSKQEIKEIWLPIGSGTLISVFRKVLGNHIKIHGVNVNVIPDSDYRIREILKNSLIEYHKCNQKLHDPCMDTIPIPSNKYYDAKLYQFLQTHASDEALWWNVSR